MDIRTLSREKTIVEHAEAKEGKVTDKVEQAIADLESEVDHFVDSKRLHDTLIIPRLVRLVAAASNAVSYFMVRWETDQLSLPDLERLRKSVQNTYIELEEAAKKHSKHSGYLNSLIRSVDEDSKLLSMIGGKGKVDLRRSEVREFQRKLLSQYSGGTLRFR